MKEETYVCAICGREYLISQREEFDGQFLCPRCFAEETVTCHVCGERIWTDDNAGNSDTPLCERCYDRYYTNCVRCGELLHNDEAYYDRDDPDAEEPLCHACYTRTAGDRAIQDYCYKPEPIFYGDGPRFFGVELEIDGAGEYGSNAKKLLRIANEEEERIYCKHDGSLEEGFEIVTHPMSLTYQLRQMPWEQICKGAVDLGYTSHQAGTCGLHVHVSRLAFGETEEQQDTAIARVLYFFEKHWEELLKFSRRTQHQLDQWASRYGYKEQPMEILDHAKKGYHGGRYTCVNLTNRDTIEFRMFRGTLKYNTLIATLQLVDRICDVAIYLSDDELKALSWTSFVSGCQATELVRDLKERRLYDPTVQHIMAGLTVRLIIVPEIESVVFVKQTAAAGAVNIVSFITAAAEDQIAAALIVVVPNAPSAVFAHRSLRFETGGTKELAIELRQLCSGKFMPTMGTYFLGFHSQLPP
mgnify:CR=1 FL=1